MEVKPIINFLTELTLCEYNPQNDISLEAFTYNGVTYAQGVESYQGRLSQAFDEFKACVLEASLGSGRDSLSAVLSDYQRANQDTFYDIPSEEAIHGMEDEASSNSNKSLKQAIQEAHFLQSMVGLQKWFLREAITFLEDITKGGRKETKTKTAFVEPVAEPENPLSGVLSGYGELLSVKDLTEVFHCTPRTITNWEARGLIVNVAETSDEVNVVGRKKRGQEKRYRKDAILRSVALREKFQEQM